jgi:hypothetical protein
MSETELRNRNPTAGETGQEVAVANNTEEANNENVRQQLFSIKII